MVVGDANSILKEVSSSYRQFPLQLNASQLEQFWASYKKALHFAIFAHAPKVEPQVSPRYDAWEWVGGHARLLLGRPPDVSLNRRASLVGLADSIDRALVVTGRAKYARHWPMPLCPEFNYPWRELS